MSKGLFLDRDGTLIKHVPYLHDPSEVCLIEGAKDALHAALASGWKLFLFTNQSGVGRGWFTIEDVHACNERLITLLDLSEPGFTEVCVAPEAPGVEGGYRKPNPRFILESIKRYQLDPSHCWMLGDSEVDLAAGRAAGISHGLVTKKKSVSDWIESLMGEG